LSELVKMERAPQLQSMAISGNLWPSVAIDGHPWQSMAISGNLLPSVAIYGHPWQSMARALTQQSCGCASAASRDAFQPAHPQQLGRAHFWPTLAMACMKHGPPQQCGGASRFIISRPCFGFATSRFGSVGEVLWESFDRGYRRLASSMWLLGSEAALVHFVRRGRPRENRPPWKV